MHHLLGFARLNLQPHRIVNRWAQPNLHLIGVRIGVNIYADQAITIDTMNHA